MTAATRPSRHELLHPKIRLKDLASQYGVAYATLWKWRRAAGAKCETKGHHHYAAKLGPDDVKKMRRLAASGVMQKDLADQFRVSQAAVSNVVNYVSYF